jgi:hypothetical protein
MNDIRQPSRQAALFINLVLGLQQSGMIALGKLKNPFTQAVEIQLDVARDTIDTLAMLEGISQGNLESDEARVLKQILTDLRMNYLEEMKKASGAKSEA